MTVAEIYAGLQGESTFAGLPCVFVRLTGCPLRCSYCDTAYAFRGGRRMTVAAVRAAVLKTAGRWPAPPAAPRLPLVELTGGEPLQQTASLDLMRRLCDDGFTVLLETSGALDIGPVDPRVRRIVDLKCPASGESHRNRWANLPLLRSTDEVKFVIATLEDYQWSIDTLQRHRLTERCTVLFSWAAPLEPRQQEPSLKPMTKGLHPLSRRELAERIIADALPVRFQIQMHKVLWPPDARGV
ncbi:MAG TPA: radical SAM protein [Verrucomicrobiota bacterium]|nr:radical SAM protein [Verrucomicrobiota bacterium]HNU50005.1 radical SAM protein [Verrucomicrobiota bacterium]